jgi:transcriptional regulator with XRE-family HTH domain
VENVYKISRRLFAELQGSRMVSAEAFAEQLGVSRSTVERAENGRLDVANLRRHSMAVIGLILYHSDNAEAQQQKQIKKICAELLDYTGKMEQAA